MGSFVFDIKQPAAHGYPFFFMTIQFHPTCSNLFYRWNMLKSSFVFNCIYNFQFHGLVVPNVTSSTAQGGGGSFKNRKPIGKVGCCESGMAERIH